MKRLLFLLACTLFLTACDSGDLYEEIVQVDPSTLTRDPALLVGTWELDRVTFYAWDRGRMVQNRDPQPRETLVFGEDGTYRRYRGGELDREAAYVVEEECSTQTGTCTNVLVIGTNTSTGWRGVSEEVLVFDERPVDGAETVYTRRP